MYLSILKDSHLSSHLTTYFHLLSHSLIDVDALSEVDVLADSDNSYLYSLIRSLLLMRYQTSTYSLILITSYLYLLIRLLIDALSDVDVLADSDNFLLVLADSLAFIDALSDIDVLADSDNFLLVLADSLALLMHYSTLTHLNEPERLLLVDSC